MKNILKLSLVSFASLTLAAGCIQETFPQTSYVTTTQAQVPGAIDRFVDAITATLCGFPNYGGGTDTANSQYAWTILYGHIKACNAVLASVGAEPEDNALKPGAGIAYFYRAYFYMDLAQMFANKPCYVDGEAETVPWVDEATTVEQLRENPRLKNKDMFEHIISDLDHAEEYLAFYRRPDKYTPDVACAYGLKARAYLLMGDWAKAKEYAKKAQAGYTLMDEAAYTSRETGFNTPNSSWMLGMTFKSDNPCIQANDADSSWGSWMCMEINPATSGCGYAANYGRPIHIDRHLYETVPESDFRKKCFADFAIDGMGEEEAIAALSAYTNHPDWISGLDLRDQRGQQQPERRYELQVPYGRR